MAHNKGKKRDINVVVLEIWFRCMGDIDRPDSACKNPPVCWKVFLSQQHTRNFAHGAVCNIWFSLVEAWTTPASTPVANDRPRALNPPTIRDRSQPLSPIKAEHKKKED